MNTRYTDAERKLAVALNWTRTDYSDAVDEPSWRALGVAPGATKGSCTTHSCIPAWARSNDACVSLMIEHACFVRKELTGEGVPVMVARWSDKHGFEERIAVPIGEHRDEAAAFRYAAVIGVTTKAEAESASRELGDMVSA